MIDKIKNKAYNLLRSSERYTKTDMVYLTSGSFWLLIKMFLVGIIALGLSVAFANLLSPHIYGEYKYVFSLYGLLAIPTLMGMGNAVTRAVAQGFDGTAQAALRAKILWGTLGSLASAGVAGYYFLQGNLGLAGAFFVVTLFLPFVDTYGLFNAILSGKKLFRVSIYYEVGIQFFSALIIAGTLVMTDSLVAILVAYFASNTLTRVIAWRMALRYHVANDRIDRGAVGYGKHLSVMEILGTVAETVDSIMLWQFFGAAPLAVFSFAKAIPNQILAALKKVPLIALPKFAQRDFESIRAGLLVKLLQMFAVLIIVTVLYVIAAPYLYTLLFPQYTEAIFYSQVFALTILLFPKKIIGTIFNAHADTKALYLNSTLTPIVKIVVTVVLIPTMGILGAILSELAAQLFSLVFVAYLFFKVRVVNRG